MVISKSIPSSREPRSLEEWMLNPPPRTEWVDGQLVHKHPSEWEADEDIQQSGMTLKHSKIRGRLSHHWINYKDFSQQGGEVYTEVPSCTYKQVRMQRLIFAAGETVATQVVVPGFNVAVDELLA